jgi:broad specificity phosphatase PhoE
MKIIFIRHGQTTGDVEDRYGGDYNDHLSELGLNQAGDLLQELSGKGIEIVISSPLIRAQETAKIVSELGIKVITEPNLKERNQYGILSGMIKSEAKEKHPDLVEKLKDKLNTIEGAESYEDFSFRIQSVYASLWLKNEYSCLAIIWHGGPMRVLFREILGKGELSEIGDCAWVELEKNDDGILIRDLKRINLA